LLITAIIKEPHPNWYVAKIINYLIYKLLYSDDILIFLATPAIETEECSTSSYEPEANQVLE